MNCTSENTTHLKGTHTLTDISLYLYRFVYIYTVLLYTTCTDGLYFCVHKCQLLYKLTPTYTHLWCTHYAWISCTTVRLYSSPVCVRLYCNLVLTNESSSNITFMNRVDQSQLRFLVIPWTLTWSWNWTLIAVC
jgi:hypothetical protein